MRLLLTILAAIAVQAIDGPPMPPSPELRVRMKVESGVATIVCYSTVPGTGWALQKSTNLVAWEDLAWSTNANWSKVAVEELSLGVGFYRFVLK